MKYKVSDHSFVSKLIQIIKYDLIDLTVNRVMAGNKIFGAALIFKRDLSLLLVECNNEIENPIWHGEMYAIKKFFELKSRPEPEELIFLSSHEPCSICLSAITWAGFDNIFYLFSHDESKSKFGIPHDIKIFDELFSCQNGRYNKNNLFWRSTSINQIIDELCEPHKSNLSIEISQIYESYTKLSEVYQNQKFSNKIPLK